MDKRTVLQHRATVLPNVGIAYVSGIISVRATKRILPRNVRCVTSDKGPSTT